MSRNRHKKILKPPQSDPALEAVAYKFADRVPAEIKHVTFDGGSKHEIREALQIRTQAIAIGIPFDELSFSQFAINLLGLHIMPWDMPITTMSTYLPMARNQIHDIFIENKDQGSHLLMLDSDVLSPPDIIKTLLMANKPIIGGWYRKKEKYPIKHLDGTVEITQRPVVYDYDKEKNGFVQRIAPGTGIEQVDGAGAGCWLMRRDVAEAIGKSPYGEESGEDLVLCQKVTSAGFPIFIDWSVTCTHCGVFFI